MARKRGLFAELQHLNQQAAKQRRQQEAAASARVLPRSVKPKEAFAQLNRRELPPWLLMRGNGIAWRRKPPVSMLSRRWPRSSP